jgi:hypothetical protein
VVSSSAFTYKWDLTTVPAGSTAKETLANSTAANPSFKADVAGAYVATMTITDGSKNVATSSVTLTACNAGSLTSNPLAVCDSNTESASNYIFDLTNRIAQAYPSHCSNAVVSAEFKFSSAGVQFLRGTDSVTENNDGTCTAKPTASDEIGVVASYSDIKRSGFLIPCGGPKCTLSQLNATYTGVDVDNRTWTQVVSHTANSNEIVSTKTWYQNQVQKSSKVTLKFIDDGYVIDLADKTASVFAMDCTPPIVALKIVFTSAGIGSTEGTDSTDPGPNGSCVAKPTPPSEVGVIAPYAGFKKAGFMIPCGSSVCTAWELNGTYKGIDFDDRAWTQVVSHTKGTKEIMSTKSWLVNGVTKTATSKIVLN